MRWPVPRAVRASIYQEVVDAGHPCPRSEQSPVRWVKRNSLIFSGFGVACEPSALAERASSHARAGRCGRRGVGTVSVGRRLAGR